MSLYDTLMILGLFLIFIGFALLVYLQLFSLFAQFHFKLMPRMAEKYAKINQLRLENE